MSPQMLFLPSNPTPRFPVLARQSFIIALDPLPAGTVKSFYPPTEGAAVAPVLTSARSTRRTLSDNQGRVKGNLLTRLERVEN